MDAVAAGKPLVAARLRIIGDYRDGAYPGLFRPLNGLDRERLRIMKNMFRSPFPKISNWPGKRDYDLVIVAANAGLATLLEPP